MSAIGCRSGSGDALGAGGIHDIDQGVVELLIVGDGLLLFDEVPDLLDGELVLQGRQARDWTSSMTRTTCT